MAKLTLPYPPSSNRYWRTFNGRMLVSAEARRYKLDIATLARREGLRPTDKPIRLALDLYRPRKSGDLSNRIKVIEDALQGTGYVNDSQVVEILARRFEDARNPRVEVTISVIE